MAVSGDRAYVTNHLSNTVSVINTAAVPPAVVDTIAVGEGPIGVAFGDTRAYVTNFGSHTVSVIAIGQAPTLAGTPPAAETDTPYSYTFTITGTPTPTASVTTGTLPTGLTLSDTGVLSGTPTQSGTFPVTITASNGAGNPATLDITLTVTDTPVVEPPFTGSLGSLGSTFE